MSELPYGPEDLKEPALSGDDYIQYLQHERVKKNAETPPLYQSIRDGKYSKDHLKLWVKDMYLYWDYALVYSTGAIYVKTNDEEVRTQILRKLVDIEGKEVVKDLTGWTTPAYEELWLRFGEGLGISREEILSWKSFTRSHYAMTTLCMLSRWWEWTWLDGVASLYAGDLHGRDTLRGVGAAMKMHYDIPDKSLDIFRVLEEDEASHIPWEEKALGHWCCTRERQLTAARAFRKRLDIENQLLVAPHRAATSEQMPLQIP